VVSYVFDASAVLRYLDGETGADRIAEIITEKSAGVHRLLMSAVNWGEVAGVVCRVRGIQAVKGSLEFLTAIGIEVVPATEERAVRSAMIKAQKKIPYADSFGVELAGDSSDHILITADFDAKPAEQDIRIEFLPTKSRLN